MASLATPWSAFRQFQHFDSHEEEFLPLDVDVENRRLFPSSMLQSQRRRFTRASRRLPHTLILPTPTPPLPIFDIFGRLSPKLPPPYLYLSISSPS